MSSEKQKIQSRKQRKKIREQVYAGLSDNKTPCCAVCGEFDMDMLTIDHVKDDGADHRRILGSSDMAGNLYRTIIKENYPKDKYQILCANHQFKKRRQNGIIPDSANKRYMKSTLAIIDIEQCSPELNIKKT